MARMARMAAMRAVLRASCLLALVVEVGGWYDTTAPFEILTAHMGDIPREHNPERGTSVLRKRPKSDEQVLRFLNLGTTVQHPSNQTREARHAHQLEGKPVIGRVTPLSGPIAGGTKVRHARPRPRPRSSHLAPRLPHARLPGGQH